MFDNLIYHYIIMALIGVIAFEVVWKYAGKLYNNKTLAEIRVLLFPHNSKVSLK